VDGSWRLPLPSFSPSDIEPVSDRIDPGDDASRHEAAYKLAKNHEAVMKFALRGAGKPGAKQFQVSS
jgi:glutathione S-transferase